MVQTPKDKEFGKRLARFREARGLSQKQLAPKIGCKPDLISKFETGRQPPRGPQDYVKLILALGVSPAEILGMPADTGAIKNPGLVIRVHRLFEEIAPAEVPDFFAIFDAVFALMKRRGAVDAPGAAPSPPAARRARKNRRAVSGPPAVKKVDEET